MKQELCVFHEAEGKGIKKKVSKVSTVSVESFCFILPLNFAVTYKKKTKILESVTKTKAR